MKNIYVTCGIYNTKYTLTEHRDGSVSIKAPYIRWDSNNTGILSFRTSKIKACPLADAIKFAFKSNTRFLAGRYEDYILEDAINGLIE